MLDESVEDILDEVLLRKLPASTCSKTKDLEEKNADTFLHRLRTALTEALVDGDEEAAAAVADAIRAEECSSQTTLADLGDKLLVNEVRIEPPAAPRVTPARHGGRVGRRPPRVYNRSRNQETAAHADLLQKPPPSTTVARATDAAPKEPHTSDEEDTGTELPSGPSHLGSMIHGQAVDTKALVGRVQRMRSSQVGSVKVELPEVQRSDSFSSLPTPELPAVCGEAVAGWLDGRVSRHRCLLEVATASSWARSPTAAPSSLPGCATLRTLAAVCGLPGGEALLLDPSLPSCPAVLLRETLTQVREAAELCASGQVTLEELHLGLRALEMASSSDPGAGQQRLRAVVTREVFWKHFGAEDASGSCRPNPPEVLKKALSLSKGQVEEEARAESLQDLRLFPAGWEACRTALASLLKLLKEEVEDIQEHGHYAMLGLTGEATDAQIRRAYRDLCLRHHPDKGGDTAIFQSLQQAHERILEDRKKGIRPQPRPPPAQPSTEPAASQAEDRPSWRQSVNKARPRSGWPSARAPGHSESGGEKEEEEEEEIPTPKEEGESKQQESPPEKSSTSRPGPTARDRTDELLSELAALSRAAAAALQRAEAAAEEVAHTAADDASALAEGPADFEAGLEPERLLVALAAAAEAATAAAKAASVASGRVLSASAWADDAEAAEAVIEAASTCATAAVLGAAAAAACEVLAEGKPEGSDSLFWNMAAWSAPREAAEAAAAAASATRAALSAAEAAAGRRAEEPPEESDSQPSKPMKREASSRRQTAASEAPEEPTKEAGESSPLGGFGNRFSSRPTSARGSGRTSSTGARGLMDALVGRRVELHADLLSLNSDVLRYQKQLLELLQASPLLLPKITARHRARALTVASEYVLEACETGEGDEAWLGSAASSLADPSVGAFRLAAMIDMDAFGGVLEEFKKRSEFGSNHAKAAAETVAALRAWVSGKA